jgi:arginyl-tRNA synthetase
MDIDLDLAKEQSQKNPLYYVMYSYARANSILEQARERGLVPLETLSKLSDQEVALIRQMARFPELILEITADYGVHRLTFFGMELARLFHDLYESERIIGLDRAEACKRLYVIERYTVFMRLYFGLLGIQAQERMESTDQSQG